METLKNLINIRRGLGLADYDYLRESAIEDIKNAQYLIDNPIDDEPCMDAILRDRIKYIKKKFNITKKDLKKRMFIYEKIKRFNKCKMKL